MSLLLRTGSARSSCAFLVCRNHGRKHGFATTASSARVYNKRKSAADAHHAAFFARKDETPRQIEMGQGRDMKKTYNIFRNVMLGRYDLAMSTWRSWAAKQNEYKGFGINTRLDFDREVKLFRVSLEKACDIASEKNMVSKGNNPLFWGLRNAFIESDMPGLTDQLTYGFQNFLMRTRFPKNIIATHKQIADFRFPHEWFPATRALQRTIYLHVGPTNSGKTYNALKALENAKSGIYSGPLRLLAHEVYSRFLAKGKNCALITGEEQRIPEDDDNYFRSCTVEMTPLNLLVDVAVIDEIQMIGDAERGWAWTQAFLGVQAKEVHLCGEERIVDLIQSLCALIGDKCVVTRYKRLNPLETMEKSIGSLKNLEKGDAVVTFSRLSIHTLKKQIEDATGRRCAMIYGSLPPETRAQQASLFNDPNSDYDFLVASDAIGMGLNLEIRRVVFEQTHKRSKSGYRQLSTSEIKQIGGRAGRFRTARQAANPELELSQPIKAMQPGLVTALDDGNLQTIKAAFNREPEPIRTAGIQPPPSAIERFSSYFPPRTPFSYILSRLRDIAHTSPKFHLCQVKEMLSICDLIQPFPMSVYDRCVFLNAPVALRERAGSSVVQSFGKCISQMGGGDLVDIKAVDLELLDIDESNFKSNPGEYLQRLEALHKTITLYLWLSYRYTGVFRSQNLAFHVKSIVEQKIDDHLGKVSVSETQRRARLERIRRQAEKTKHKKKVLLGDNDSIDGPQHELRGEWNEEGHEEPLFNGPDELRPITQPESTSTRSHRTHHHETNTHVRAHA
ncbi:P-loop containing nucleoside triphosphate hydrolase protein [Annulohypoxylon maeteangense]|uniref:P-loop containing nucleoside triphosphate hydrolase protein n=1 Tax=Annulohypoxylon maeteangense TaxID=1927788 RepID=UPI002007A6B9|nr:P-loop containing nucleoside triphosphate hydrolase protein [Annulohypoxylon maeteangense]KAI0889017.1 P-loop containing nucleoside triphosphate hydrolase protein [Annulohypoxylon maeteangense]